MKTKTWIPNPEYPTLRPIPSWDSFVGSEDGQELIKNGADLNVMLKSFFAGYRFGFNCKIIQEESNP